MFKKGEVVGLRDLPKLCAGISRREDGDIVVAHVVAPALIGKVRSQGIAAAQAAAAAGISVYSAAYGAANSGGCSTDNPAISPCATMQQIATSADKFFPDSGASSVSCTSTVNTASDIIGIFTAIGASLSTSAPRLILNSTS